MSKPVLKRWCLVETVQPCSSLINLVFVIAMCCDPVLQVTKMVCGASVYMITSLLDNFSMDSSGVKNVAGHLRCT